MIWAAVAVAGAAGAVLRHLVDVGLRHTGVFPWATAVVNLSGAFLLGAVVGVVTEMALATQAATVAGAAFCGAYTTFSTWMVQTLEMLEDGRRGQALLNLLTVVAGVLAAAAGWAIGGTLGAPG